MESQINPQELHRLFAAKADGTITPGEHEQLAILLKGSATARAEWFAFQDAEAALLEWAQRESLRREEGIGLEAPAHAVNGQRPRTWSVLKHAAPLAAAIVAGVVAWVAWTRSGMQHDVAVNDEATTSSVAVLSRGVNMEWDSSLSTPGVKAPLAPGLLRLRSGVAEIEFFQGARLCIEGPAEIRLVSAGEAFCQYGRFSAHVPPEARGFKLGTPKGDIVDLGTDFGLDLNDAAPELHVFKGEVELHQPKTPMRKLTTGTAAGLEESAAPRLLAANTAAFTFSQDLDARVSASRREAFARWQQAGAAWNADPDLRLRLDFQDKKGSRSLNNVAAQAQDLTAGTIVGGNWTEGRWPGKRALQFRSVSDRVRLNIPGEYRQMTLSAWVQVHSLNTRQSQSSICMSQGLDAGAVHWQILHDGSICLGIVATAQPQVTDDYISPVVFTPERFGQWTHVAAVYDTAGKEVRFYVDGRQISRHPLKHAVVPTPKISELGNWMPAPAYRGPHAVRNFVGLMDEFSLFSRALSSTEVRALAN